VEQEEKEKLKKRKKMKNKNKKKQKEQDKKSVPPIMWIFLYTYGFPNCSNSIRIRIYKHICTKLVQSSPLTTACAAALCVSTVLSSVLRACDEMKFWSFIPPPRPIMCCPFNLKLAEPDTKLRFLLPDT